ncbi:hypothetical protein [Streptomyces clavuligerus]|nr:hypothetical protein [Streptomyces clavuligerus]
MTKPEKSARRRLRLPLWLPWSCLLTTFCLSSSGLFGTGVPERI